MSRITATIPLAAPYLAYLFSILSPLESGLDRGESAPAEIIYSPSVGESGRSYGLTRARAHARDRLGARLACPGAAPTRSSGRLHSRAGERPDWPPSTQSSLTKPSGKGCPES